MADLGTADLAPAEAATSKLAPAAAPNPLIDGPILPTLLRLAAPNILSMGASIAIVIAETSYIGRLGTAPLAAIALMFPLITLMMTMSGGAMGGGAASAISRALGAGDTVRASTLAVHALVIGLGIGATFSIALMLSGEKLLILMGGRDLVLQEALAFSRIFFPGVVVIWVMNTFVAILRATGNMKLPSAIVFLSAFCQIGLGGVLTLGLAGAPQLGIRGIAIGQLTGFSLGALVMGWVILSGRARISLRVPGFGFRTEMFADILKVGVLACLYPIQSVLTLGILTAMLARFGPEVLAGYGVGARYEFLLTTIAFGTGVASIPMIGMAIGAGRVARARRVAWTGMTVSFVGVGVLGALTALFPSAWVSLFTDDPAVRAAGAEYMRIAGVLYAFLGIGISLYFSSQGAAKVLGSVIGQFSRLVFVLVVGSWLLASGAGHTSFFILAGAAMVVFGLVTAFAVLITPWGAERPRPA
jgi:putative MATE family efflux protein